MPEAFAEREHRLTPEEQEDLGRRVRIKAEQYNLDVSDPLAIAQLPGSAFDELRADLRDNPAMVIAITALQARAQKLGGAPPTGGSGPSPGQRASKSSAAPPVAAAPAGPRVAPTPTPTKKSTDKELVARQARLEKIKREAREQAERDRPAPELTIIKASDVPDEKIEKLFGGRLIRGTFTPIVGAGEVGKGMLWSDMAARFTRGTPFPADGDAKRDAANVLVCTTEDSMGRVKARLRAAGADLDRVNFITGPTVIRGGLEMPSALAFDSDAGRLVRDARQLGALGLFLETTLDHLGDREGKKRIESNNELSVRRALEPIRAVCREAGMFGTGALHPRKGTEGSVEEAIAGSIAFRNVARGVLHVFQDPMDEAKNPGRLLASSKANYLAFRPRTLRFRIESWEVDADEGHVVWGIEEQGKLVDDRTVEEIWRQGQERGQRKRRRRDLLVEKAEKFLMALLVDGKVHPLDEIQELADAEGHTWDNVKKAKVNLDVVSVKAGFPAEVIGWQLTSDADPGM